MWGPSTVQVFIGTDDKDLEVINQVFDEVVKK